MWRGFNGMAIIGMANTTGACGSIMACPHAEKGIAADKYGGNGAGRI